MDQGRLSRLVLEPHAETGADSGENAGRAVRLADAEDLGGLAADVDGARAGAQHRRRRFGGEARRGKPRDGRGPQCGGGRQQETTSVHHGSPLCAQSATERSRSALPITVTELRLMAALAIIGLSSSPNHG
jgi:hypothetical protein